MLERVNLREIVKLVRMCINAIGTPEPGPVGKPLKVWSSQGTSVTILGINGVRAFGKLVRHLEAGYVESKPVQKVYARKTLNSKMQELISGIVNQYGRYATKEQVSSAINEWVLGFHADFPLTNYYVPVINLKLRMPLTIGKVIFRPMSPEFANQLLSSHNFVVDHANASDELKERLKRDATELLQGQNSDVVAEIALAVDEALGYELCINYVEQALNVLRYYGYFLYPQSQQTYIGIQGRLSRGNLSILHLIPGKRTGSSYRRTGPLAAFDLSDKNLDRIKAWGLDFLSKLLTDEPSNEVAGAVLSGIEWSGRGSQILEPDTRYLNLWTAVETLLTCEDDKKRTETQGQLIAKRVSLILPLVNKKKRESVQNLWNEKLYKVRCDLVHQSHSQYLIDYLPKLEFYAPRVIMCCIEKLVTGNNWPTKAEFLSSLEAS